MSARYTALSSDLAITIAALDSLADGDAALSSELSNDATDERRTLANFSLNIAATASRSGTPKVYLLIFPKVNGVFSTESSALDVVNSYAKNNHGNTVEGALATGTATAVINFMNVEIPNGDYKVGIYNDMGVAFAASGNTLHMTPPFSFEDVAESS